MSIMKAVAIIVILIVSSSSSLAAWKARSPNGINRLFSTECGETEYSLELHTVYSGKGVQLKEFARRPGSVNKWMKETAAATFDSFSDVFRLGVQCGHERDGKPEEFLVLDVGGYSRESYDDAMDNCRRRGGMFDFETRRWIEIGEDYVTVSGNEIGTCITDEEIQQYKRLNEGPEL